MQNDQLRRTRRQSTTPEQQSVEPAPGSCVTRAGILIQNHLAPKGLSSCRKKTTNQQKTDARRQISSLLIKYRTESSSEYGDATEESEPCCGQPGQQLRPQREENLNRGKHR